MSRHNISSGLLLAGMTLLFMGYWCTPVQAQQFRGARLDVIVTREPAVLVQVAGDPVLIAVDPEGTVGRVANASTPLYQAMESGTYWLRVGSAWHSASELEGPYARTSDVPTALTALGDAAGGVAAPGKKTPTVYVRSRRATLIQLLGDLRFERIGSPGGVHVVEGTDADLFFFGRNGRYYLLAGGRWHSTASLERPWRPADSLPGTFAEIPPDHPRGYVLSAVPDTPERAAAVAEVERVSVHRVPTDQTLDVTYDGEPVFTQVPATNVAYCSNTAFDVFTTGGLYYCCHDGVWYLAATVTGPWSVCAVVPDALYRIPESHPKHRVTSVIVHPTGQPGRLMVGRDLGYEGWRVVDGYVVHQTWYGPFPSGHVRGGVYRGPYDDGEYLAPDYGNWGRKDWATRVHRRPAPVSPTATAPAPDRRSSERVYGADAPDLEERRREIESRGVGKSWLGKNWFGRRRAAPASP